MKNYLRPALACLLLLAAQQVRAEEIVKIGVVLPLTGPLALGGQQLAKGVRTFMAMRGNQVAGKTIELDIRDDGAVPDATKRIAQEMVVNDGVKVLTGFGLTPLGAAAAPIATQAHVPLILMSAAGANLTQMSPYIVRVFQTLAQPSYGMARWAAANNLHKVVTLVAEYGPGIDAEEAFKSFFGKAGGTTVLSLRAPLANPDFAPFLQRAKDAGPDGLFVFAPPGPAGYLMRQFNERGLAQAGTKFIGAGDFVPEETVANGEAAYALGVISAQTYSPLLQTPENKAFVEAYRKAAEGALPDIQSVSAFDGMDLIYRALDKTHGDSSGPALLEAMKGMKWASPRGPVEIDATTRDVTQNVYIRQFRMVDGKVANVPIATYAAVKPQPE